MTSPHTSRQLPRDYYKSSQKRGDKKNHTTTTSCSVSRSSNSPWRIKRNVKPLFSFSLSSSNLRWWIHKHPRPRNQLNIINRLHAGSRQEEEIQCHKFQILINQRAIGLSIRFKPSRGAENPHGVLPLSGAAYHAYDKWDTRPLQTYNTPNHYCCMHLNCIRTCSNSGQTLQEMSVKMRTEDLNACTQPCAHEWNSRTAKCEGEGTEWRGSWNGEKEG